MILFETDKKPLTFLLDQIDQRTDQGQVIVQFYAELAFDKAFRQVLVTAVRAGHG